MMTRTTNDIRVLWIRSAAFIVTGIYLMVCLPMPCFPLDDDPPLSHYNIIEERNFFRPKKKDVPDTGKKSVPNKTSSGTDPSSPSDLVVTGMVKIKGRPKAIIEKKSQNKGFYVGLNETVDGFLVRRIEHDYILLENNGKNYTLSISSDESPSGPSNTKEGYVAATEKTDMDSPAHNPANVNMMQGIRSGVLPRTIPVTSENTGGEDVR